MSAPILVLNVGSSSIKFALFETDVTPLPRVAGWHGKVEGIHSPTPTWVDSGSGQREALALPADGAGSAALGHIHRRVRERLDGRALRAVAHRVVHGGTRYSAPTLVDAAVLADLRSYIPLAPLHQPFALEAIETLLGSDPGLPQVACFDTAFHRTMPVVETLLPLPYSAWQRGVRRYGFHGLSYDYVAIALAERHGNAARGNTIVAHLGSGASLCGMQGLRSVATTMGFSALDGLMMGTRCGALDPGAVLYLMEIEKLTLERVGEILYHESGLLGVSGVSADPRALLPLEADNAQVREALALYVRRIVREIGALAAALGGIDLLVFTAGIGEHNAVIRERVCAGLAFLGIAIDGSANAANAPLISSPASRVLVGVEPTNEEWIAARDALDVAAA